MTEQKDTIYIDVDDEITSIIEKTRAGKHKILALVLPKRATMLQSIVNMKLLKRTADEANKRIVLITSEAGLLPLAGAVGLHVAKTLQTKPAIPPPPEMPKAAEAVIQDGPDVDTEEPELDDSKSVGELAGLPPGSKPDTAEETIDIEDEPEGSQSKTGAKAKKKGGSKLKVPNFERFRTRLFLAAGGLVLLLMLWFFAYNVLPKAKITIKTDTLSVDINVGFTADITAKSLDEAKNIIPAEQKTTKKTDGQKVTATGQKNVGEKATGTMTVFNCTDNDVTIPAGTRFTSGGLTYAADSSATVPASDFNSQQVCKKNRSQTVAVSATEGGTKYNVASGQNYSSNFTSTLTGSGSKMSGGTDKTVQIVSQQDVDNAKQKIVSNNEAAKADLIKVFREAGKYGLGETITAGTSVVTASPNVGDLGSEVSVSATTDYTMLGVKEDDLKKLIENEAKKQIDTKKQAIADYGLSQAAFSVTDKKSADAQSLSVQAIVSTGAQINTTTLKKQIAGKKRGDVQSIIQAQPSVKDVIIEYSPFWVYKTPKQTSKITIIVQKPQTK